MEPGFVLQIILVIIGGIMLCETVLSLAKRRITESFSLVWGVAAIVIVLAGVLLRPAGWNRLMSTTGLFLALIIVVSVIIGAFFISSIVSTLMRKVNELAIQVSLNAHENDELRSELQELQAKVKELEEKQ